MSGIVELRPGEQLSPLPPERPGSPLPADPAEEIAARFAHVAATAVHPLEVAAAIEAEGITDSQIQRRYGRQDVFELAEELFAAADRSFADPEPVPSPWRTSFLACLLRGALYTLPVLGYVLGARLLSGTPDRWGLPHGTLAIACSVLVSWGWNQGLSHRAYRYLGLGDRRGAALALLRGAPLGVLLAGPATVLVTVCMTAHGSGWYGPVWFGLGQSLYFASSTVLLIFRRELVLLLCLLPVIAGTGWLLADHTGLGGNPSEPARTALLLASVVPSALAALAVLLLTVRGKAPAEPAEERGPGRVSASLPYGIFGLAVGTLALSAGLGDLLGGSQGEADLAAPRTVALTLSMGLAEWLLYAYRRRIDTVLATAGSPGAFSRGAAEALMRCLGGYLALLAALAYAVTALWPGGGSLPVLDLLGMLALGATIWTGLVLQTLDYAWTGALVAAGSATCLVALLGALHHVGNPEVSPAAELAVCGVSSAVLVALSGKLLGRVTRHR